jgi:hypothetical protein
MLGLGLALPQRRGLRPPAWALASDIELDIDFVNGRAWRRGVGAKPVTDFISTTRASDGYAKNAAGVLVPFGSDVPRIVDLGLFAEDSRTNLILRSQEFGNDSWTKIDTTVTADAIAAPDGTLTADLLTEGTAGTATVVQGVTATANVNYGVSGFVKAGTARWIKFWLGNGANQFMAWFDLLNGVVGTTAGAGTGAVVGASIEAFANGWYRCKLVGSVGSGATAIDFHTFATDADNSNTRVNNATRYEWGRQFENNVAFVTSYIPTAGSTATRAADAITIGNFSSWYNAAAGTFFVEWSRPVAFNGNSYIFTARQDAFNLITVQEVSTDNGLYRRIIQDTSNQLNQGGAYTDGGGPYKVTLAYAANDATSSFNGSTASTDVSVNLPTPTELWLGSLNAGSNSLNGLIRRFAYWRARIANARVQAFAT